MTCVIAPVFAFFIHSIYKVPAVPHGLAYPVRMFMWVDDLRATTSACRAQVSHSIDLLPIRVVLAVPVSFLWPFWEPTVPASRCEVPLTLSDWATVTTTCHCTMHQPLSRLFLHALLAVLGFSAVGSSVPRASAGMLESHQGKAVVVSRGPTAGNAGLLRRSRQHAGYFVSSSSRSPPQDRHDRQQHQRYGFLGSGSRQRKPECAAAHD